MSSEHCGSVTLCSVPVVWSVDNLKPLLDLLPIKMVKIFPKKDFSFLIFSKIVQ